MIIPILTYVYDRKHQATNKKTAPVELRMTYNGKKKYLTTGIRLLPKHWKNGTVTNREDAMEINKTLGTLMANVMRIINDMMEENDLNTAEIKSRLQKMNGCEKSFLDFCDERVKVRAFGKSKDTLERYERFMRWLRRWGKIVFFSDVTEKNIMDMDEELQGTGMKNYSKWNNYHRFMNSFILDAMDEGFVKRNPYRWLHIGKDQENGLHKYLTPEEMARMESAEMPTASLERVRDLFVFQAYTCLSYTDMAAFSAENAAKTKSGAVIYTAKRNKTGQEFKFVLLDKAQKILDKYNGKLPLISNVKYNEYLKIVAQSAHIDKPITSHWARHTGATMLLNAGVDMEVVAKVMGHATTKQTRETYAKLLDDTVEREMRKIDITI